MLLPSWYFGLSQLMVGFVPGCFSVLGLEKREGAEGWTSQQQTNQEEPRGSTAKWEPGTAMRGSACHSARQPSRALTRTPGTPGLPLQTINTACFSSASMTWRKRQWFNVRKKKKNPREDSGIDQTAIVRVDTVGSFSLKHWTDRTTCISDCISSQLIFGPCTLHVHT